MTKLKKTLLISTGAILIIAVVAILLISPITKYLIEKYDEKYTGRQITMGWAYVNPFTGYIHFNDIKIHELKTDSVFFSADGISIDISMFKLFSKTFEISNFTLNHPTGTVVQNKKYFNFNDLIEKFSTSNQPDSTENRIHFNILSIRITDGELYYHEELIPVNYAVKKINFESSGKRWDSDTLAASFSFVQGMGSGDVRGNFTYNLKSDNYRTAIVINKFDLNIIEQYLRDLTNYGTFSANADADITASGNINNEEDITVKGLMAINSFHFGKNKNEDYAAFEKVSLGVIELSPIHHKYIFDTVSISHPYFKYERYDSLDNIQTIFGKDGSNITSNKADPTKFNLIIEIADYIKVISRNFFQSDYKINRFSVDRGEIKFNDFSLSEKFSIELNPLAIFADSIDKNHPRINIALSSRLQPFGNVSMAVSINPKDSSDFDLAYHLQKIPITIFNPYFIASTSYPLDRGTVELNGSWTVVNGNIKSNNHLLLIDPRLTRRTKNKAANWLPLWLAMAFVRESGNVIDYEVPITGSLKDPKFHFKDVVVDILTNIFVKPATTTYRMEVKNAETEIEKSLALKWEMRRSKLSPKQEKFVKRMGDFLKANPDATLTISPQQYTVKEQEYILFFEAKKKYFLFSHQQNSNSFSEADSELVDKMSVKDSSFVRYLNKKANDSMLFTVQDKCNKIIHASIINERLKELQAARENTFTSLLEDPEVVTRVKFAPAETMIPYNGFSIYKIEYKGAFPESLLIAYRQMNELDNKTPRKKFKEERRKNKNSL